MLNDQGQFICLWRIESRASVCPDATMALIDALAGLMQGLQKDSGCKILFLVRHTYNQGESSRWDWSRPGCTCKQAYLADHVLDGDGSPLGHPVRLASRLSGCRSSAEIAPGLLLRLANTEPCSPPEISPAANLKPGGAKAPGSPTTAG